jgi:hypothetical protein
LKLQAYAEPEELNAARHAEDILASVQNAMKNGYKQNVLIRASLVFRYDWTYLLKRGCHLVCILSYLGDERLKAF